MPQTRFSPSTGTPLALLAAILLAGCGSKDAPEIDAPAVPIITGPAYGSFGVDLAAMDTAIAPGEDFYAFANGAWLRTFELPPHQLSHGAFTDLIDRADARIKAIVLDAASASAPVGSLEQKIGDFYTAYADIDAINRMGLRPLTPVLDEIADLDTHQDVALIFGRPDIAARAPFRILIDVDRRDPTRHAVYLSQGGLGMPSPEFYQNPEYAAHREAYRVFLIQMLRLTGVPDQVVAARALDVYALETRLAGVHWSPEKMRNEELVYNPYTIDELMIYASDFPWRDWFDARRVASQRAIIVRENSAIRDSARIFAETPVPVWRDYLAVHALNAYADVLPDVVEEIRSDFYVRALHTAPSDLERADQAVGVVNTTLSEAVGQLYVARHFSPEARATVNAMVTNLLTVFGERIDSLSWMTKPTKTAAREKLAAITTRIGYPDLWADYSELVVRPGDAFGNRRRADRLSEARMLARLGRPVDRSEWPLPPQTVNAFYAPDRNEITFPAAILEPPLFDPAADLAVNYGAIGAIIGHELGHALDNQGRFSDAEGFARDWWAVADEERFKTHASRLARQFQSYHDERGLPSDPSRTLNETIGDLGGLALAYDAYRRALGPDEAPIIDGYTGDQRFFLAWAQVWRRKYSEGEPARRLVTDTHALSEFRTNGVVRHFDAWYTAFGVTETDALFLPPAERVQIW